MGTATSGDPSSAVIECRGAGVKAQMRSVATVISVTGRLDAGNVEAVLGHLCRFTNLGGPLVVDVTGVHWLGDVGDGRTFERLISTLGAECHWRGVDWILVGAPASRVWLPPAEEWHALHAGSVAEALQHFIDVVHARRHMPLAPLVAESRRVRMGFGGHGD